MKDNSILLQINTRIWLNELRSKYSPNLGHFFLDEVPDNEWQLIKNNGFNVIYLLGVWDVGELTEDMFRIKNLKQEFDQVYPDWKWEDTCSSPFSIKKYQINPNLGNADMLKNLKKKLNQIGVDLILDFVPNHFGLQTENVTIENLFIEEESFTNSTKEYEVINTSNGSKAIYHGKDPYFPPWEDTLQLDYSSETTRKFMKEQLKTIAEVCNGVRCDMAMLIVNRIFQQNWGFKLKNKLKSEFWQDAINEIKRDFPDFKFIAEVYWDMEEELINLGFDYCYDKKLYDAIRDTNYGALEYLFHKDLKSQNKNVRFLENHDEQRSLNVFKEEINFMASVITYTMPGIKFFHQKQLEGYRIRESLFLIKRVTEQENANIKKNYALLLELMINYIKETSLWSFGSNILQKNIDVGRNIYLWEWSSSQENFKFIIIINFKNVGSVIELDNNLKEFIVFNSSTNYSETKVINKNKQDMLFELKPFGCLFIKVKLL